MSPMAEVVLLVSHDMTLPCSGRGRLAHRFPHQRAGAQCPGRYLPARPGYVGGFAEVATRLGYLAVGALRNSAFEPVIDGQR